MVRVCTRVGVRRQLAKSSLPRQAPFASLSQIQAHAKNAADRKMAHGVVLFYLSLFRNDLLHNDCAQSGDHWLFFHAKKRPSRLRASCQADFVWTYMIAWLKPLTDSFSTSLFSAASPGRPKKNGKFSVIHRNAKKARQNRPTVDTISIADGK